MTPDNATAPATSWWPYGLIAAGLVVVGVNLTFIWIAQTHRPEIVPSYLHDADR